MEINEKRIKLVTVNEAKKTVTVVADDMYKVSKNALNKVIRMLGGEAEDEETKVVAMSKPVKGDEFDKYIGVALALAYVTFGSKTKFHKYVDSIQIMNPVGKKKDNKKLPSFKELNEKYTLQQLRDIAKENNLKGYTRLTKEELIKELYSLL